VLSTSYFLEHTESFYDYYRRYIWPWKSALPNAAHEAISRMEEAGRVLCVVTQNIDRLHQKAGCSRVLELHGNIESVICLGCGVRVDACEVFDAPGAPLVPRCARCGSKMKPEVVLFDEPLPTEAFDAALNCARECDLLIAAGTSLSVMPAALLPEIALGAGARVAIINREPTPFDYLADTCCRMDVGEALQSVACSILQ